MPTEQERRTMCTYPEEVRADAMERQVALNLKEEADSKLAELDKKIAAARERLAEREAGEIEVATAKAVEAEAREFSAALARECELLPKTGDCRDCDEFVPCTKTKCLEYPGGDPRGIPTNLPGGFVHVEEAPDLTDEEQAMEPNACFRCGGPATLELCDACAAGGPANPPGPGTAGGAENTAGELDRAIATLTSTPDWFYQTENALHDLDKTLEHAAEIIRAAKVRVIKAAKVEDGLSKEEAAALMVSDAMIAQLDRDLGMDEPAVEEPAPGALGTAPNPEAEMVAKVPNVLQRVPCTLELSPQVPRQGSVVLVGWFDKGKNALQTCAMTWKVKSFRPKDGKLSLRPHRVHKSL